MLLLLFRTDGRHRHCRWSFLPDVVWKAFPYALTLEGQYIVKNLVLIGAGLVLGGTVKGGQAPSGAGSTPREGQGMRRRKSSGNWGVFSRSSRDPSGAGPRS